MSKQFIAILVIIVGGFFGVLAFSHNKNNSENGNTSSNNTSKLTSHIMGKADSKVKLIEYGDFQCPACGQYAPIITQLEAEYKDKVSFQFRHFPLTQIHQNAFIGSRAAEAAGNQGKFFEMRDILYSNQSSWSNETDPSNIFVSYASQLGLNADQFKADMNSSQTAEKINADRQAAQALGATGTPTFVLNDKKLDKSPSSIDDFKKLLDEALSKNQ